MTDQSHTPLPWQSEGEALRMLVRGADATIVALRHRLPAKTHEANVALIVRSVNSLPSLVKALETVHEFMMEDVKSGDSDLWTVGYSELFDEVDRALSSYRGEGK